MNALLLALTLQGASATDPPPGVAELRAESRRAAEECGFEAFVEPHPDVVDMHVLIIADTRATDTELQCAARLEVDRGVFISFGDDWQPSSLSVRYTEALAEAYGPERKREAQEWFAQRPQYSDPPLFDPQKDLGEEFAEVVSQFCDGKKSGVLTYSNGAFTLGRDGFDGVDLSDERTLEVISCVFRLAQLNGLAFGFLGNELVSEQPE